MYKLIEHFQARILCNKIEPSLPHIQLCQLDEATRAAIEPYEGQTVGLLETRFLDGKSPTPCVGYEIYVYLPQRIGYVMAAPVAAPTKKSGRGKCQTK